MNDRQRVLVVVALGLALAVVAGTWIAMLHADEPGGGWFAYAPSTSPIITPDAPSHAFRDGVIMLVAVLVWAAASFRLLRSRTASEREGTSA